MLKKGYHWACLHRMNFEFIDWFTNLSEHPSWAWCSGRDTKISKNGPYAYGALNLVGIICNIEIKCKANVIMGHITECQ